jgi:hypothetical protein
MILLSAMVYSHYGGWSGLVARKALGLLEGITSMYLGLKDIDGGRMTRWHLYREDISPSHNVNSKNTKSQKVSVWSTNLPRREC